MAKYVNGPKEAKRFRVEQADKKIPSCVVILFDDKMTEIHREEKPDNKDFVVGCINNNYNWTEDLGEMP